MADCPGCGGVLRYDISTEKVVCDFCRQAYEPAELDTTQLAEETDRMGVQEFHCPNCGGDLFSTDRDVTGVCSYCGSRVIFESRLVSKKRPQLIIPFQKTKEECRQIYANYLKGKLFVPKELKKPDYIESIRGIYMPYWISDVTQEGQIRYYSQESETKGKLVLNDTYRVEGELHADYHHLYHDGGAAFSDDLSEKLEPYQLFDAEKKPLVKQFYPAYLSGFYAEPADMDFSDYKEYFEDLADHQTLAYLENAEFVRGTVEHDYKSYAKLDRLEPLDQEAEARAAEEIGGRDYADIDHKKLDEREKLQKLRAEQYAEACKSLPDTKKDLTQGEVYGYQTRQNDTMALFPVWFLAWRKKDRVSYLTINGQTGRVCADLPIDYVSFFGIFLLIAAACFAVFSLFTVSVYMMPVLAAWLSAVVLRMDSAEIGTIRERSGQALVHKKRIAEEDAGNIGIFGLGVVAGFAVLHWGIAWTTGYAAALTGFGWRVVYAIACLLYGGMSLVFCLGDWVNLPKDSRKFPVFFLDAAAEVLSFAAIISNSPKDSVLYGCSAAAFLAIALTMVGMIRQYNISATRSLPQMEHRGGDDDV